MRIGVDIDGVVSDSYKAWVKEMNRYFGTNILQLKNYDMHLDFGVSWEEMGKYFKDNVEYLFTIPNPVVGAKEGLERLLRDGHEIVYITARSQDEEVYTIRWLDKHEIPYKQILFTDFGSKVDHALEWELELFIEDFIDNAVAISEAGVPVLLLDTSYNQGDCAPLITRCQDWQDILSEIRKRTLYSKVVLR